MKRKKDPNFSPYYIDTVDFCNSQLGLHRVVQHVQRYEGTLLSFCQETGYDYGTVYQWLKGDKHRWTVYSNALESRKAAQRDLVLTNMVDAVTVDPRRIIECAHKPCLLTAAEAKSITGWKDETDKTPAEIKFTPIAQATETLAKHLGMMTDKLELTGKDGGPVEMGTQVDNDTARRIAFLLSSAARDVDDGH